MTAKHILNLSIAVFVLLIARELEYKTSLPTEIALEHPNTHLTTYFILTGLLGLLRIKIV